MLRFCNTSTHHSSSFAHLDKSLRVFNYKSGSKSLEEDPIQNYGKPMNEYRKREKRRLKISYGSPDGAVVAVKPCCSSKTQKTSVLKIVPIIEPVNALV